MNTLMKTLGFFSYTLTFFIPKLLNAANTIGCEAGEYLPIKVETVAGEKQYAPDTTCKPCPSGYYCPESGSYTCETGNADVPGVCTTDQGSIICPAGSYCPAGSKKQTPCPAGKYTDSNGASECKLIAAGYWGTNGAKTKTGNGMIDGGYYSAGGAKTKTPTGEADCNNNDCGYIAGGHYSAGGATTATPTSSSDCNGNDCGYVATGYYSNGGATASGCSLDDTYCEKWCLDRFECDSCKHGTNNQFPNSDAGSMKSGCYITMQNGIYITFNDNNWTTGVCPVGTYSSYSGNEKGYYGTSTSCKLCPQGTTTANPQSESPDACNVECPTDGVNKWADNPTGACQVQSCKAGYRIQGGGCTTCLAGTYMPNENLTEKCYGASPGYYISSSTSQTICPAATYSTGGDGITQCPPIDPGYYSSAGAKKRNPANSSDCNDGNSTNNTCGLIAAGYYCNKGAENPYGCGQIAAGHYSAGGATKNNPTGKADCNNQDCGQIAAGYWGTDGATTKTGNGMIDGGYYSAGGAKTSTGFGMIDRGHYSAGGAKTATPTSSNDCNGMNCGYITGGFYSVGGATTSAPTSSGYCNNQDCGLMTAGYWSERGGTSTTGSCIEKNKCGLIAAGYWGSAGETTSTGKGKINAGYYSTAGATKNNPTSNADCNGNDCGQIAAGYWGADGAKTKNGDGMIAAGYWGSKGATTETGDGIIASGYYSAGGATTATPTSSSDCNGNDCGYVAVGHWSNGGGTSATPTAPDNGCLKDYECGKADANCFAAAGSTTSCPVRCIPGTTAGTNGCVYDLHAITFSDTNNKSFSLPFNTKTTGYMYIPKK